MNTEIRELLIERAKIKAPVSYGTIMQQLELNTSDPEHRKILSHELAEISRFEVQNQRPMLSSMAMYEGLKDFGPGFYPLAEELGFGNARQLENSKFAFQMQRQCFDFWNSGNNQNIRANDIIGTEAKPLNQTTNNIAFFTIGELEFFKKWQLKVYDKNDIEHVSAKNYIMDTVWEKSIYLGKLIAAALPDFALDAKKIWHKLGSKEESGVRQHAMQFKPYTWIKIFKKRDIGKHIFFTFGIEAYPRTNGFVYKIDCQRERGTSLSEDQIYLIDSLIPESADMEVIPSDTLINYNWDSLTKLCVNFIREHEAQYDAIINALYGGSIPAPLFKNSLAWRPKPKDGFEKFPETKRRFTGFDTDHLAKTEAQMERGDAGEELVKQFEINYLFKLGLHEEAKKVEIVKPGEGYDIHSFDENGRDKYIEVKTTEEDEYTPFFLSPNEIEFMKLKQGQYCIYRIYNYNKEENFGECFKLKDNVFDQLLLEASAFKVLLRKGY
jgi:hypothetical protein